MSIKLGTIDISGAPENAVNRSLSNLDATGQAVIDNKANIDLTNLNSTGKSTAAILPMAGSSTYTFTIGTSGASYTMPYSGLLYVFGTTTIANGYIYMSNSTIGANQISYAPAANYQIYYGVYVAKGDIVNIGWGGATCSNIKLCKSKGDV